MPITIRMPAFGGIKGKEHHGESPETFYVHTAGLKVVAPSGALDAYRLLRLAIADPDPVIVLEPKARYWSKEDGDLTVEGPGIGAGRVLRDGGACTVVLVRRDGGAVPRRRASVLADEGIEARVVDLRIALAARRRPDRRLRARHRSRRRRARGAEDPGARRRGHRALIVEEAFDFLEAPVAPGHGMGRAVSAGGAGTPLPAQRAPHRGGGPRDGERTDGPAGVRDAGPRRGSRGGRDRRVARRGRRHRRAEPAARRGRDREGGRRDPLALRRGGDRAARAPVRVRSRSARRS